MTKHYAARNTRALGEHFTNHLSAMTGEKLHAKFAIAAELAWRDQQIETLNETLRLIGEKAHAASTGPAEPDAYWDIRGIAYEAIVSATGGAEFDGNEDDDVSGMAEGKGLNPYFEGLFDGESDELCALRLTLARERDEARAIANDRDAMVDHRDRALTAMYQRVDIITQERDEAIAELETERLRLAACGVVAMANTPESAARVRDILPVHFSASLHSVMGAVDREMELRAEVERLRKTLDEIATYWNGSHRPAETLDAAEWTRGVAEEALAAPEAKP